MKKIKRALALTVWLAAIMLLALACNDDLDVRQAYKYSVETLPLPKSLEKGESVALEFSIVREGEYTGASYKFRYFQSDGEGSLKDDKGKAIPVNRFQSITSDDFVLIYTNLSEEQAQLDFVFEDNFGQRVEYKVTFAGKRIDDEEKTEKMFFPTKLHRPLYADIPN